MFKERTFGTVVRILFVVVEYTKNNRLIKKEDSK